MYYRDGVKMDKRQQFQFADIPVLAVKMTYEEYGSGMVCEDGMPAYFVDDYEEVEDD